METMVSHEVSRGQGNEFLNKLEAVGLTGALAQKVIDSKDNELGIKVVRLIENGGFEPSTLQTRAREIMGRNFFGVEEAIKHFGVNPSRQQLAYLAEVPYSEEALAASKDTHVLVAVFPLSMLDVRGKVADKKLFYSQDWYNREAFAKEKGEVGWRLVRKTSVADSTNKTWNEQQTLLSSDEETPTAQVMVYTIIGHYLATGERLFENVYVRTSSLGSGGCRVNVGDFGARGLLVYDWFGDDRDGSIGVSSARKFS